MPFFAIKGCDVDDNENRYTTWQPEENREKRNNERTRRKFRFLDMLSLREVLPFMSSSFPSSTLWNITNISNLIYKYVRLAASLSQSLISRPQSKTLDIFLSISVDRLLVAISSLQLSSWSVCESQSVFYVRAGYPLLRVYRVVGRILSYIQGENSFLYKTNHLYASSAISGPH
ncbi:unnamed protein product [Lactuca saligna]|uniref:Uncharacterized protein n=1 Tax=Lactuca saligna TaxID=75948 RepID=A0AA36E5A4_LACSI|nr:unnamed protein product [Lactuca saligna]